MLKIPIWIFINIVSKIKMCTHRWEYNLVFMKIQRNTILPPLSTLVVTVKGFLVRNDRKD
jgi:hypothetical protein